MQKNQLMSISTKQNPDYINILVFKKKIKEYLKKGYRIEGDLVINKDGSITQNIIKVE